MKLQNRFMGIILILCTLVALGAGCGQKGPPLPPKVIGRVIAEPYDLKLTPKDDHVLLSWSHRIDPIDAQIRPDNFDVFMARKTLDACKDCPFQFKQIASVSMPKKEFMTRVEKGYKYYFRVQATGEGNLKSEYSKTVQFESK